MAPKIIDHDEHRDELARRSWPAFARSGYERITTRELARAIGISAGALYHYFPTKQALFEHAIRTMAADDVARIERLPRPGAIPDRIGLLLGVVAGNEERVRALLLLLLDYLRCTGTQAHCALYEETLGRYSEVLTRYLGLADPLLAEALMVYADGLVLRRAFMLDAPPFAAQASPLASVLSAALARDVPSKKERSR